MVAGSLSVGETGIQSKPTPSFVFILGVDFDALSSLLK